MDHRPKHQGNVNGEVLFMPDWRGGNPYQELLASGIETTGLKVDFMDFPDGELALWKASRTHPGVRVLHLHWIKPLIDRIFWRRSPVIAMIRTWILALNVWSVRLSGVRVVWTVHNRVSHESPNPDREIMARRWLARSVSRLIFHSENARDAVEETLGLRLKSKSEVIPHGNYVGVYKENGERAEQISREFGLQPDDRVLLFFGGIRRYKGITTAIEGLRLINDDSIKLIIAGRALEQKMDDEIRAAAKDDPRIIPCLGFIAEEDVHPLYSIADLAVIPFEQTLTSGSAILALSMGKALLLPENARVIGLPDFSGTIFFDSKDEFAKVVSSLDRETLQSMGRTNRQVASQLNWGDIGSALAKVYRI